MPYQPETSYFVSLDAPPAASRFSSPDRDQHWNDPHHRPEAPSRRRHRPIRVRPVGVLLLAVLGWVGWAYTTPGGPSARINDWIDHTRGDVAAASVSSGLSQSATYFDQLYASQGSYPNMSETAIQEDPRAGFGLSMNFSWCSPRAVVLQSVGAGGAVSRLLLDGHDLGNVIGARSCPSDLTHPSPWTVGTTPG